MEPVGRISAHPVLTDHQCRQLHHKLAPEYRPATHSISISRVIQFGTNTPRSFTPAGLPLSVNRRVDADECAWSRSMRFSGRCAAYAFHLVRLPGDNHNRGGLATLQSQDENRIHCPVRLCRILPTSFGFTRQGNGALANPAGLPHASGVEPATRRRRASFLPRLSRGWASMVMSFLRRPMLSNIGQRGRHKKRIVRSR